MSIPQPRYFVGRKDQLSQFGELLADSQGRAVLIVGSEGMGKTTLALRLLQQTYPGLSCAKLIYEIPSRDSLDAILDGLLRDVENMIEEKSSFGTRRRREQWRALLEILPKGKEIGNLLEVLGNRKMRRPREQFLAVLDVLSRSLPPEQRIIFLIDPVTYLAQGSDEDWTLIVRELPDQIIIIFPQRPDDILASSRKFLDLRNVTKMTISGLDKGEVADLLAFCQIHHFEPFFERYEGHPYAIGAALDLIIEEGLAPEALPADPNGLMAAQWKRVCDEYSAAIPLFFAYAVLEVPVPDSIVRAVTGLEIPTVEGLYAKSYLQALLRGDSDRREIYHPLLARHVLNVLGEDGAESIHRRGEEVYRERFRNSYPDELAARRWPRHVLVANREKYSDTVVKCSITLRHLGLLTAAKESLENALLLADDNSMAKANVYLGLGEVCRNLCEHRAYDSYEAALKIYVELDYLHGVASSYLGLGNCYADLGLGFGVRMLDCAVENYHKALRVFEKEGNNKSAAAIYSNLGKVYFFQEKFDESETMYSRALEILVPLGDTDYLGITYLNFAELFEKKGDPVRAEEMYCKSQQVCESIGARQLEAATCIKLAMLQYRRHRKDNAERNFQRVLKLLEPIASTEKARASIREHVGDACMMLHDIYVSRGDLDAASRMHRTALESGGFDWVLKRALMENIPWAKRLCGGILAGYDELPGGLFSSGASRTRYVDSPEYVEAYVHLRLAEEGGDSLAKDLLELVVTAMTDEQVAEGKRRLKKQQEGLYADDRSRITPESPDLT